MNRLKIRKMDSKTMSEMIDDIHKVIMVQVRRQLDIKGKMLLDKFILADAKSMFLEQRIWMIQDALSSGDIQSAIKLCFSAEDDCQEFMKMREDSLKKDYEDVQKDDQEEGNSGAFVADDGGDNE